MCFSGLFLGIPEWGTFFPIKLHFGEEQRQAKAGWTLVSYVTYYMAVYAGLGSYAIAQRAMGKHWHREGQ